MLTVPPFETMLPFLEKKLGRPLTPDEVGAKRRTAPSIVVSREQAQAWRRFIRAIPPRKAPTSKGDAEQYAAADRPRDTRFFVLRRSLPREPAAEPFTRRGRDTTGRNERRAAEGGPKEVGAPASGIEFAPSANALTPRHEDLDAGIWARDPSLQRHC